jgi:RNA polymerase sigma factor (sigma-70 family)
MTEGKSDSHWPGADDRAVVEEMLRNSQSEHWTRCREFVRERVRIQAKNIPQDSWEDIVQKIMIRVEIKLSSFEHESKLKTWLIPIIRHCIIDDVRQREREEKHIAHLGDLHDPHDDDDLYDAFTSNYSRSLEDECINREELREAAKALLEHLAIRDHPERDKLIVQMVIYEGHSYEEAAKAAGCTAAVVGYVVRTAQGYVRQKLGHQRQKKAPRKP